MAFYNKWHCKFTGIKGFVNAYEDGLRYRMLTEKAKYKAKLLVFWEKHGLVATMDAFSVKRSTLFLWKKKFKDNQGKEEADQLNKINNAKTGQPIELIGYIVYDKDGNDTGKRFLKREDAEEYMRELQEADKNKTYENKIKEN